MLELTKKRPTEQGAEVLKVVCPQSSYAEVMRLLLAHACTVERSIPAAELLDTTPAACLRGARCKENMTQAELSEKTGIPRRHISDMENGRRPIGKANAKKLGDALSIGYKVFW